MINLIKADIQRLKHDKALLVGFIIVAAFAFATSLLYLFIKAILVTQSETGELFRDSFNFLATTSASLSVTSNVGLLAAIIAIIVVAKEFSYGTIRNKVIAGYSRFKIYLSQSFVCFTVSMILYLTNIILSILFGMLFLGVKGATASGVAGMFAGIGIASLVFIFCSLIANFYTNCFKTVGVPIVLYVVTVLVLTGLGEIYAISMEMPSWVEVVCEFNPMYQASLAISGVGNLSVFTAQKVAITLLSEATYIALITLLGGLVFTKTDLK